jgi:hypothetical protein
MLAMATSFKGKAKVIVIDVSIDPKASTSRLNKSTALKPFVNYVLIVTA